MSTDGMALRVECPAGCDHGEFVVGIDRGGSGMSPPEAITVECDVCDGEGVVSSEKWLAYMEQDGRGGPE